MARLSFCAGGLDDFPMGIELQGEFSQRHESGNIQLMLRRD
jgi:hypothetical protein